LFHYEASGFAIYGTDIRVVYFLCGNILQSAHYHLRLIKKVVKTQPIKCVKWEKNTGKRIN